MLIDKAELRSLIPHAGSMCLLDAVEAWDGESIRCITETHLAADNPLRRDGRLHALHALEYGAQAMAVHGGLRDRADGRPPRGGYLVAAKDLQLEQERLDTVAGPLTVEARQLLADGGSMIYEFDIRSAAGRVAHGRATVMAQENP